MVEEFAIGDLMPNPKPQRKHGERKITRLMGAIEKLGQLPILTTDSLVVLNGHAVLEACRRLGRKSMSVIRISHLSANAQRALMMAVNKLGEGAEWDMSVRQADFQIMLADPEFEFSLDFTGFDQVSVDQALLAPSAMAEDEMLDLPANPFTRTGDLWVCGEHRVLCGDSRDANDIERVMAGGLAQLAFGDVPYNLKISGNVSGLGKHKHGEFAMASGEMDRDAFVAFQKSVFEHCKAVLKGGGLAYLCIDWRHVRDQIEAGEQVFGSLKQMLVWV